MLRDPLKGDVTTHSNLNASLWFEPDFECNDHGTVVHGVHLSIQFINVTGF